MRNARFMAVFACMGSMLVACSSGAGSATDQPPSQHVEGDQAVAYSDVADLTAASTAVILATATNAQVLEAADADGTSGLKSTITTLNVTKVVSGTFPAGTVKLRELGDVRSAANDVSPFLKSGTQYVMFIVPFHFSDGKDTGEYVLTDGSTLYTSDGSQATFAGAGTNRLPAKLALATLESEVSSAQK